MFSFLPFFFVFCFFWNCSLCLEFCFMFLLLLLLLQLSWESRSLALCHLSTEQIIMWLLRCTYSPFRISFVDACHTKRHLIFSSIHLITSSWFDTLFYVASRIAITNMLRRVIKFPSILDHCLVLWESSCLLLWSHVIKILAWCCVLRWYDAILEWVRFSLNCEIRCTVVYMVDEICRICDSFFWETFP
jgi:hypothetical protein